MTRSVDIPSPPVPIELRSRRLRWVRRLGLASLFLGLVFAGSIVANDRARWVDFRRYPGSLNLVTAFVGFLISVPIVFGVLSRVAAAFVEHREQESLGQLLSISDNEVMGALGRLGTTPGAKDGDAAGFWFLTRSVDLLAAAEQIRRRGAETSRVLASSVALSPMTRVAAQRYAEVTSDLADSLQAIERAFNGGTAGLPTLSRQVRSTAEEVFHTSGSLSLLQKAVERNVGLPVERQSHLPHTVELRSVVGAMRLALGGEGPAAVALLATVLNSERANALFLGDAEFVRAVMPLALQKVLGLSVEVVTGSDRGQLERMLRGGDLSPLVTCDCVILTDLDRISVQDTSRLGTAIEETGQVYGKSQDAHRTRACLIAHTAAEPRDLPVFDEWLASRFAYMVEVGGDWSSASAHLPTFDVAELRSHLAVMGELRKATTERNRRHAMDHFRDGWERPGTDVRRIKAYVHLWSLLACLDGSPEMTARQAEVAIDLSLRHVREGSEL